MSDDHDETPAYDPTEPTTPEQAPPRRETAPQSEFTHGQALIGVLVLLAGLGITIGVPFVMA